MLVGALLALALPASANVVRVEHRDPTTLPTLGPANAMVTVELFFVPGPGMYRWSAIPGLARLAARHPSRVRVVYRVLKRNTSQMLPIALLEAHAQGKFFELLDQLVADRTNIAPTRDKILERARALGIDPVRLSSAISDGRYADVFAENDRRFDRMRGNNPPTLLFNGRLSRTSIGSMNDAHFEDEYRDAYERALELVDRGIAPRAFDKVFEEEVLRAARPFVVPPGRVDDGDDPPLAGERLASPPLALAGLPSYGKPGTSAPVRVVVLCRPNDFGCGDTLNRLRSLQQTFADDVHLVWAPWFDVARDDAADLALLGDAALCAERIGTSSEDFNASPGWSWIARLYATRNAGRRASTEGLIDAVAKDLDLDGARLSACRARLANASLAWIAAARRSGVRRSPAVVIGGRIYEGLADHHAIRQLVEAELAPGILGTAAPSWQ